MAALPRLISASDESGVLCVYDDNSKPKVNRRSYAREVLDVFLPAGYPHTVTRDYTPYQIYVSFLLWLYDAFDGRNFLCGCMACIGSERIRMDPLLECKEADMLTRHV